MELLLNLQRFQENKLFSKIYDFRSFARVKILLLQNLISFWKGDKEPKRPYVFIDTENSGRVFMINSDGHKMVSFGFEFIPKFLDRNFVTDYNKIDHFNFLGQNGIITYEDIKDCILILNETENLDKERFFNYLTFTDDNITKGSVDLLYFLLMSEAGYVRYDHDVKGYKKNIHPIDHIDINYSANVTYKMGLRNLLIAQDFQTLFNDYNSCPEIKLLSTDYPQYSPKKKKFKKSPKNKFR